MTEQQFYALVELVEELAQLRHREAGGADRGYLQQERQRQIAHYKPLIMGAA